MSLGRVIALLGDPDRSEFESRIRGLMADADRMYAEASACYGFECTGCDENCCGERFYHHTLSEYLLLSAGLDGLDDAVRQGVVGRAVDAAGRIGRGEDGVFCPLHEGGRCRLYGFRPMICRLHGVPHVLIRPGIGEQPGSGCHRFASLSFRPGHDGCRLDRTPLYAAMAGLEIDMRRALGFSDRIRMTVADMIVDRFNP